VDATVIEMLRAADRPLTQEDILARLKAQSIRTPSANGEVFLRRLVVPHAHKIIKLTGRLGYWEGGAPLPAGTLRPEEMVGQDPDRRAAGWPRSSSW
jgi:hypothetical protein